MPACTRCPFVPAIPPDAAAAHEAHGGRVRVGVKRALSAGAHARLAHKPKQAVAQQVGCGAGATAAAGSGAVSIQSSSGWGNMQKQAQAASPGCKRRVQARPRRSCHATRAPRLVSRERTSSRSPSSRTALLPMIWSLRSSMAPRMSFSCWAMTGSSAWGASQPKRRQSQRLLFELSRAARGIARGGSACLHCAEQRMLHCCATLAGHASLHPRSKTHPARCWWSWRRPAAPRCRWPPAGRRPRPTSCPALPCSCKAVGLTLQLAPSAGCMSPHADAMKACCETPGWPCLLPRAAPLTGSPTWPERWAPCCRRLPSPAWGTGPRHPPSRWWAATPGWPPAAPPPGAPPPAPAGRTAACASGRLRGGIQEGGLSRRGPGRWGDVRQPLAATHRHGRGQATRPHERKACKRAGCARTDNQVDAGGCGIGSQRLVLVKTDVREGNDALGARCLGSRHAAGQGISVIAEHDVAPCSPIWRQERGGVGGGRGRAPAGRRSVPWCHPPTATSPAAAHSSGAAGATSQREPPASAPGEEVKLVSVVVRPTMPTLAPWRGSSTIV